MIVDNSGKREERDRENGWESLTCLADSILLYKYYLLSNRNILYM